MRRLTIGALLVALLAACGGDDEDTAASRASSTTATTTLAPATTVTTAGTATTATTTRPTATTATTAAPAPACPANAIAGTPADVTEGTGDFDGDGKGDVLKAYRLGSTWHLRAELAAGGAADTTVTPMGPAAVKAIGGANLGRPNHVAFATVGSGASTVIVGLYFLRSCQLGQVVNEEAAARFPVGASVGNQSGVECADHGSDGTQNLLWHEATSNDGTIYRATTKVYAFSGESIATVAPGVVGPSNIAAGSPGFSKYSTLTCGSLKLA